MGDSEHGSRSFITKGIAVTRQITWGRLFGDLLYLIETGLACLRPRIRPVFRFGLIRDTTAELGPNKTRRMCGRGFPVADTAVTMETRQTVTITIDQFVDRRGNPARVDGVPEWSASATDRVQLTPADDGMSCRVDSLNLPTDPDAPVTVRMDADSDLGAGRTDIFGQVAVTITQPQATEVRLSVSTPTDTPNP